MTAFERNFATFHLEDNVYELADSILPELGERLGQDMTNPDEALGQLVGKLGPNKVLRENDTVQDIIPVQEMAGLIERSGILLPLNRSLWTPDTPAPSDYPTVLTGAVANWQDRTAKVVAESGHTGTVHIAAGNRRMNAKAELANPYVASYVDLHTELMGAEVEPHEPTEAQYSNLFLKPILRKAGRIVRHAAYATGNGDEIAKLHIEQNHELLDGMTVARVANAGVQMALQWRNAARSVEPDFDNRNDPEMFIVTDGIEVARSDEQIAIPATYQSPFTAARQLVVTAKLLQETQKALANS